MDAITHCVPVASSVFFYSDRKVEEESEEQAENSQSNEFRKMKQHSGEG